MKSSLSILLTLILSVDGCSQNSGTEKIATSDKAVGGVCEGCEAVMAFGNKPLQWIDTLPDFNDRGPKLEVSGTIYHRDGKTPADDVILYIYHTDQEGIYPTRGNETGWEKRHGYIRGWIRTNEDGQYKFYTLKPGAYPSGGNPAHIHPVVKEPGVQPYWIDEFLFEGDPYISDSDRKRLPQRGGPGILKTRVGHEGMLHVKRDIILGKNIPGY